MKLSNCILFLVVFLFSTNAFAYPVVDGEGGLGYLSNKPVLNVKKVDKKSYSTDAADDFLTSSPQYVGLRTGYSHHAKSSFMNVIQFTFKPSHKGHGHKPDFKGDYSDDIYPLDDIIDVGHHHGDDKRPTAPVPEPSIMLLLGSGLVGMIGIRKKYSK